jgi:antitoxin HigA-1
MSAITPVHPGAILRTQFMGRYNLSASALAIRLHVPAPRVNDIVRERRGVSPDSALRLARYFRTSAQYWMDLQTAYDLAVAQAQAGEQIANEVQPAPQAPQAPETNETALAA